MRMERIGGLTDNAPDYENHAQLEPQFLGMIHKVLNIRIYLFKPTALMVRGPSRSST